MKMCCQEMMHNKDHTFNNVLWWLANNNYVKYAKLDVLRVRY